MGLVGSVGRSVGWSVWERLLGFVSVCFFFFLSFFFKAVFVVFFFTDISLTCLLCFFFRVNERRFLCVCVFFFFSLLDLWCLVWFVCFFFFFFLDTMQHYFEHTYFIHTHIPRAVCQVP
jgi:hypothetical protein